MLSRYNPMRDIDSIFDEFFGPSMSRSPFPSIRVWEANDNYSVQALVPGLDRQSLEIEASPNGLTIQGRINFNVPDGVVVRHTEFRNTEFRRTLQLATQIQTENVQAQYQDGVLTVTLPKAESARVRRVNLSGEQQQPEMLSGSSQG